MCYLFWYILFALMLGLAIEIMSVLIWMLCHIVRYYKTHILLIHFYILATNTDTCKKHLCCIENNCKQNLVWVESATYLLTVIKPAVWSQNKLWPTPLSTAELLCYSPHTKTSADHLTVSCPELLSTPINKLLLQKLQALYDTVVQITQLALTRTCSIWTLLLCLD